MKTSQQIAKLLRNSLNPNSVYTVYRGPKGLTFTRGSMEYRDKEYTELLVFSTGDDVPGTLKELVESVEYQMNERNKL